MALKRARLRLVTIQIMAQVSLNYLFIIFHLEQDTNFDEDDQNAPLIGEEEQYTTQETIYVRLPPKLKYDLKIEHFDDMLQDNSF